VRSLIPYEIFAQNDYVQFGGKFVRQITKRR